MSGAAQVQGEVGGRRARHSLLVAAAIGCYVLAVIAGMFYLVSSVGMVVQILLWVVHGVLLTALVRKLGARESSSGAALFIVLASAMSVYVASVARDDLTLLQRGKQLTATVVEERRDPGQGRKARDYNYELEHQDGTRVPGHALKSTSDSFDVGQTITVIEDPDGELRPQTPGQADATGDALGAGVLALAGIGAVAWMTWRGSDAAKRRDDGEPSASVRKVYKIATHNHTTPPEQEEKLRGHCVRILPTDAATSRFLRNAIRTYRNSELLALPGRWVCERRRSATVGRGASAKPWSRKSRTSRSAPRGRDDLAWPAPSKNRSCTPTDVASPTPTRPPPQSVPPPAHPT